MSLIHRHRQPTIETPEQTLARLRDAVPTRDPVPDNHPDQRFTVARKNGMGYNIAEVDTFIDTIGQRTADEIRNVIFTTQGRRNHGYDEDEVDRFLDEQIARLNTETQMSEPTDPPPHPPPDPTRATTPEMRGKLGRIPQRRWRYVCAAFWLGLALSAVLGDAIAGSITSSVDQESTGTVILIVALIAIGIFWEVGAARTGQIDPSEWTTTQRVSKYINDHLPEGGYAG
jgi:DivIVA domain-containing protein